MVKETCKSPPCRDTFLIFFFQGQGLFLFTSNFVVESKAIFGCEEPGIEGDVTFKISFYTENNGTRL